jgi:hypothetical protein
MSGGFVPLASARSTMTSVPGGIEVRIPSRRNWVMVVFLALWLCGWVFGEFNAAAPLRHPAENTPVGFLAFWIVGWTVGGCFAVATLAWMLAGHERVTIAGDEFTVRREACGLGWTRRYELRNAKNLRVGDAPVDNGPFGMRDPSGFRSGPFAFDYGPRSIRFGVGLDVAEARNVLAGILAAKPALSPNHG